MTSPDRDKSTKSDHGRMPALVLVASIVMVALYGVNAAGSFIPALAEWSAKLTNVEGQAREGGIEIIEAILWAFAALAFGWAAMRLLTRRQTGPLRTRLSGRLLWCGFFAGLSFMALGEETSWGQVYGWYSAPESVAAINAQEEFNLHNLDVAEIWGLEADHPLVPYLKNLSHIINPIFYAFFLTAWVLVPLGIRKGRLRARWWTGYPVPPTAVSNFFACNVIAWLIVDRLLFDVGELFELSISITIALVAGAAAASWNEGLDEAETSTAGEGLTRAAEAAILDDFARAPTRGSDQAEGNGKPVGSG